MIHTVLTRSRLVVLQLVKASNVIAGTAVITMVLVVAADVLMRMVAGASLRGAVEYNEALMVVVVFLAIAPTQANGGHVSVTLLTSRFSARTQRWLAFLTSIPVIAVLIWATWVSFDGAITAFVTAQLRFGLVELPVWPMKAAIAIGFLLLLLTYVTRTRFPNGQHELDASAF